METAQIKTEFDQIIADEMKTNGLSTEQAVDVAKTIMQEAGKFKRTEMMNHSKQNGTANGNGTAPASDKQKDFMRKLKISFSDNVTKGEAIKLIDAELTKPKDGK